MGCIYCKSKRSSDKTSQRSIKSKQQYSSYGPTSNESGNHGYGDNDYESSRDTLNESVLTKTLYGTPGASKVQIKGTKSKSNENLKNGKETSPHVTINEECLKPDTCASQISNFDVCNCNRNIQTTSSDSSNPNRQGISPKSSKSRLCKMCKLPKMLSKKVPSKTSSQAEKNPKAAESTKKNFLTMPTSLRGCSKKISTSVNTAMCSIPICNVIKGVFTFKPIERKRCNCPLPAGVERNPGILNSSTREHEPKRNPKVEFVMRPESETRRSEPIEFVGINNDWTEERFSKFVRAE